eukprot:scaffold22560_cov135-Cylindrotheca_fusiformis.AAC.84
MVEFGLKLQDNKVSEWSRHYLNYEKLKEILKKAKAAQKSYDEQAKKRPEDAAAILEAHRSGDLSYVTITPSQSLVDMRETEEANEKTSLIDKGPDSDAASATKRKTESTPLSLTRISDYFGSRYERTLRGYLEQIDKLSVEFGEAVTEEQKKTVSFYHEKLTELENRLQYLVESVVHSKVLAPTFMAFDEDDPSNKSGSVGNPIVRIAKKMGMTPQKRFASVVSIVQKKIQREKHILDALRKGDKDMAMQIELLPVDDDDHDVDNDKVLAEADSIKRALIDQYRTATLLKNFAIMNYTGFVKIIKKHDKSIPDRKGRFKSILDPENLFDDGKEVDDLSKRFERYYANWFCEGDVREATAAMLTKKGDGLEMDWSQLRYVRRSNCCALPRRQTHYTEKLWVCWDCIWGLVSDGHTTIGGRAAFPVFRACGGILILQWFWGCSVFIWSRYRVNYIYLFDLDPRIVSSPISIFEAAVDNTLVFMVIMLLYYKDIAWTICWVFSGEFASFEDLKYTANFSWVNARWYKNFLIPIICLFPLLIRFNQCLRRYIDTGDRFPHLANAAKYALSQTVTLFGAFHPLYMGIESQSGHGSMSLFQLFWMLVFVTSSLYSFAWDVFMDWGLGKQAHGYLGPSLMYPKRSYYYAIMAIDLVLRFMWVLTLIPPSSGAKFEVPSYLSAGTMMLELFRRTLWGFLRLENEHRSNAAGFRRVSFVPLHFNTGHGHNYADKKLREGQSVLKEVVLVSLIVLGVCVSSIIAAQSANSRTQVVESDANEF